MGNEQGGVGGGGGGALFTTPSSCKISFHHIQHLTKQLFHWLNAWKNGIIKFNENKTGNNDN